MPGRNADPMCGVKVPYGIVVAPGFVLIISASWWPAHSQVGSGCILLDSQEELKA